MPESTWANPLYTIVHAHFSGRWRDYEEAPSDETAGLITQINVRHSCAGPRLKFDDEKFYGIAAEREGGRCIFDQRRHGGLWNWRRDQAIIDQAMDDDGFVQPGRPGKPAWVLRLLRLFDGHPFYRGAGDGADPPGAKRQRTEPSAGVHPATESASAASASTEPANHQEVDALVFVCDPERAPLPSANAEADAVQQCFAPHGRRAVVQRGGDATTLRELLERHRPRILHFIGHADAKHPLNKELTLGFTAPDGALITILPETVLELLTSLSAISFLELVVLNGCRSVAIADKVAAAGIPAIGWDTVVDDKPAAAFGPPLYGHLLQHADKPLYESLPAAFEQAVLAVKALTGTNAKANGDRLDGYALADPAVQPRNSAGGILGKLSDGSGRRAAGLPVLISRARFPPATAGATRLPPPAYPPADSTNGRDEQIGRLHAHFFPMQRLRSDSSSGVLGAAPTRQAVLQAIRGLGGIGKVSLQPAATRTQIAWNLTILSHCPLQPQTTLALEYARRHAASYPAGVAFVSADAVSELELLQRIARALRLYELASKKAEVDELRDELHAWLRQNVGWLLIVDNADDAGALSGAVQRSLPASDALGHVLLTSRVGTEAFGALGIDAPLTLGVLAPGDATRLLVREAGRALGSLDDAERCAAEWLAGADALAGLPLALLQAGKMVREKKLSFARYRERFERRYLEVFKAAPSGTQRQEQSVHTTWLLNLETLEEEEPAAAELLALCSLLAPDAIPAATLFARVVQGEEGEEDEEDEEGEDAEEGIDFARAAEVCPELVKALDGLDVDERQEKIEELLGAAQRYSLLDFDADAAREGDAWRSVSMHRLVQDAQRRRAKRATEAVALLSELLVAAMPGIESGMACTGEAMERFRRLRSHVVALRKEAGRLGAVRREVAALLGVAATALDSNGEYAEAAAMQREVLAAEREVLGPRHPRTLTTMGNLASTLRELGKPAEAEAMEREVLAARRELLGPRHPDTLATMNNLASTLGELGKPAEAEALEREVLAAEREVLGPRHPSTLTTMNNLASTLGELGKPAEAEALEREVLAARRELLGPRHPSTLTTMGNLASTLRELGKHAEAAAMQREVLAAEREVLGARHPSTLTTMGNLASTLRELGKPAEAEALEREVLAAEREVLGPRHPHTLTTMSNLASTLRELGKPAEAEAMQREVLAARREVLGPRHPDTLTTMNNLAMTLGELGKPAEAEAMEREVLAARREVLGPRHPRTLATMNNLASTLRELGKPAEAEAMQREVLAARREVLGPRHPDTLATMSNLASTLRELGKPAEAEAMQREVLAAWREVLGARHPSTLTTMGNLASTLRELGKPAEAEAMQREVLAARQELHAEAEAIERGSGQQGYSSR